MKNTVSSLAILTSNWYVNKRDYIENFVPFIATLIKKRGYEQLDVKTVCADFAAEFGLSIPYHPMQTVLIRARKRGLLKKYSGVYVPIKDKVLEHEFSGSAKDQMRKQEKVIKEIGCFASEKYSYEMPRDRAESAFVSFLKEHDLDILFAAEGGSILPDVVTTKQDKHIVYSFICHAYESEPEVFQFIVDTAIGHLMANSILYREFNRFVSKLKGVYIYLDTRIILRLLGLEGEDRAIVYEEFLRTLLKEGARLRIFRHTYEETFQILEDCLHWIENSLYNPSRATSVLRFFVSKSYTKLDVQRFITKIETTLEQNGVTPDMIVDAPHRDATDEGVQYQIDEEALQKAIVDTYKKNNPYFEELKGITSIQRDIKSITAVYKLRKGKTPSLSLLR